MTTETVENSPLFFEPWQRQVDSGGNGYTQSELSIAFGFVRAESHWKDPINAIIPASMRHVVEAAVIYYTATVPSFQPMAGGKLIVRAAGYRAGPAGDH